MALPFRYRWLESKGGPKIILVALSLYGTEEIPGGRSNPKIISWAKELGIPDYTADSIPWCGLFVAYVVFKAGWADHIPANPLWARDWAKFGQEASKASLGDVLVFSRNGGGHVGFYVGEDDDCYHVLGGNQSDAVTITRIRKERCIAVRRPKWRVAQPPEVTPIFLEPTGKISTNEV